MRMKITGLPDMPALALDTANISQAVKEPEPAELGYGIVGHEDKNPQFARIEESQIWIEVTTQPEGEEVIARLGAPAAGPDQGWYAPLSIGCRVILLFVGGDPSNAVILGRLWDSECTMPASVAGVDTSAGGASAPEVSVGAPCWHFLKTASGQMLGIETGANGDILIHSAASVEVKSGATGAIHLNGRVALGEGPTTPPVGKRVGPANTEIPGVQATPNIPVLKMPTVPVPPATIVPYVGRNDGIIRAKDMTQSHAGVDPAFWLFISGVFSHPLILAYLASLGISVPPIAVHSEHGGWGGPGSQHTASD